MMRTSSNCGKARNRLIGAGGLTSLVVSLFIAAVAHRPASAQYQVYWV
jgi:hypothetical protein